MWVAGTLCDPIKASVTIMIRAGFESNRYRIAIERFYGKRSSQKGARTSARIFFWYDARRNICASGDP